LNKINKSGNNLEIDACVTLQQLLESTHCPAALVQAIKLESALNIRNTATVAGALIVYDGRSPFATSMLALDAKLTVEDGQSAKVYGLTDYWTLHPQGLITKITIPLNIKLGFESVARSPMDRPIVCAAVAQWSAGRTRLALGGYGKAPLLAMDGTEPGGIDSAAQNAFHEATDEWASAEYRMDVAAKLAKRCLETAK
jgi:CO/xanthine dehydrogenase FAD-binding subunit